MSDLHSGMAIMVTTMYTTAPVTAGHPPAVDLGSMDYGYPQCRERAPRGGRRCTRTQDHEGWHGAWDYGRFRMGWPQEPFTDDWGSQCADRDRWCLAEGMTRDGQAFTSACTCTREAGHGGPHVEWTAGGTTALINGMWWQT